MDATHVDPAHQGSAYLEPAHQGTARLDDPASTDPVQGDPTDSTDSGRLPDPEQVRRQVAELVSEITSGTVATAAVLAGASLLDLGLDSLGWLRLIDALEVAHGVEVDLAGTDLRNATVEQVVSRIRAVAYGT